MIRRDFFGWMASVLPAWLMARPVQISPPEGVLYEMNCQSCLKALLEQRLQSKAKLGRFLQTLDYEPSEIESFFKNVAKGRNISEIRTDFLQRYFDVWTLNGCGSWEFSRQRAWDAVMITLITGYDGFLILNHPFEETPFSA